MLVSAQSQGARPLASSSLFLVRLPSRMATTGASAVAVTAASKD